MRKPILRFLAGAVAAVALVGTASAGHTWNDYHWARTTSPLPLLVVDSVDSNWQFEFNSSISEWNQSSVLNMSVDSSNDSRKTRKRCAMVSGQMRVCNSSYGNNGWLGLASIGLDNNGHIDQGTAKVNDSYSSYWADPNEKRHVMCQEVGHVFGLGHTSENGSSQQTCMDYSNDPNSISPNQHDYDLLDEMYAHLDDYNSYAAAGSGGGGGGKPCNPNKPGCNPFGLDANGKPPMGVRVHKNDKEEVWVASRPDGGYWIHHVRLAPEAYRKHLK